MKTQSHNVIEKPPAVVEIEGQEEFQVQQVLDSKKICGKL